MDQIDPPFSLVMMQMTSTTTDTSFYIGKTEKSLQYTFKNKQDALGYIFDKNLGKTHQIYKVTTTVTKETAKIDLTDKEERLLTIYNFTKNYLKELSFFRNRYLEGNSYNRLRNRLAKEYADHKDGKETKYPIFSVYTCSSIPKSGINGWSAWSMTKRAYNSEGIGWPEVKFIIKDYDLAAVAHKDHDSLVVMKLKFDKDIATIDLPDFFKAVDKHLEEIEKKNNAINLKVASKKKTKKI